MRTATLLTTLLLPSHRLAFALLLPTPHAGINACAPRAPSTLLLPHDHAGISAHAQCAPAFVTRTHRQRQPVARARVVLQQEVELDVATVLKEAETKLKKSVALVVEQLSTLRVGRATADMLDRVMVEYYGAPTPLNQLASVSTPTAQQLVVDVYDKSCLGDVEKALMESDLGMNPSNDGSVIRLNVPTLTAERRKELAKTASKIGEEGKVALRNVRRDAMDKIKKMQKEGLSEDESRMSQDDLQKALKKYEAEVESSVEKREKEIKTI